MSDKTILITGGATGIGAAAVKKFVDEGWNAAFIDINVSEAERLMKRLGQPGRTMFVTADTRRRDDIAKAVSLAMEHFGGIDSVFANAGIHRKNTITDITDEELDLLIDTNIRGTINTIRAALPAMIARGGGSIVINCSDQWFVGKKANFGYGLTKGALGQMTRSLAVDLAEHNIRVNAVCAGTIATPLVDNIFEKYAASHPGTTLEELWREENALYARGSVGRPEEVAEMVYFLASERASFCTGGHYLIDGGLVAGR